MQEQIKGDIMATATELENQLKESLKPKEEDDKKL